MSQSDFSDLKLPMRPRSHVRFTREQYLKLLRDMIESGKSILWLLKTTYFKVAGHSDLRTTERYAKARDERVIESQRQMDHKLRSLVMGSV